MNAARPRNTEWETIELTEGNDRPDVAGCASEGPAAETRPAEAVAASAVVPGISIRRATPADSRAIAEIGAESWQAAYRQIVPADFLAGLNVAAREVAWRARLESEDDDGAPSWVATQGERAIGFAASGPPRDEDVPEPAAEIYAIYVRPDTWRRGAGRALLEAATQEWLGRGARTLALWVLEANENGRAFYEAMGWRPDGARQTLDLGGIPVLELRYRLTTAS